MAKHNWSPDRISQVANSYKETHGEEAFEAEWLKLVHYDGTDLVVDNSIDAKVVAVEASL